MSGSECPFGSGMSSRTTFDVIPDFSHAVNKRGARTSLFGHHRTGIAADAAPRSMPLHPDLEAFLELVKNREQVFSGTGVGFDSIAVGFVISFIVAIIVIKAFVHFVSRHGFGPFAWYRIVAGAAALFWLGAR